MSEDSCRRSKMVRNAVVKVEGFVADLSNRTLDSSKDCLTGDCALEFLLWLLNPAQNRVLVSAAFRQVIEEVEKEIREGSKSQKEADGVMAMVVDEIVQTALRPFGAEMLEEDLRSRSNGTV